jgi:hypothetical protein
MDKRRLTKEVMETDLSANAQRRRPRRTCLDRIDQVIEKSQIKSTRKPATAYEKIGESGRNELCE